MSVTDAAYNASESMSKPSGSEVLRERLFQIRATSPSSHAVPFHAVAEAVTSLTSRLIVEPISTAVQPFEFGQQLERKKQRLPTYVRQTVETTAQATHLLVRNTAWSLLVHKTVAPCVRVPILTGDHIKWHLRYTRKALYFAIITYNIWSYLLRTPVIVDPCW